MPGKGVMASGWRCSNDDGFCLFHAARTMADNSGAKRWEEGLMWSLLSVLSVFHYFPCLC